MLKSDFFFFFQKHLFAFYVLNTKKRYKNILKMEENICTNNLCNVIFVEEFGG